MENIWPLLIAEGILLLLVLIALPAYAVWKAKQATNRKFPLMVAG